MTNYIARSNDPEAIAIINKVTDNKSPYVLMTLDELNIMNSDRVFHLQSSEDE